MRRNPRREINTVNKDSKESVQKVALMGTVLWLTSVKGHLNFCWHLSQTVHRQSANW